MARVNTKVRPAKATPPGNMIFIPAWKGYLLFLLAACWSPVSQLTLSPTHGSIPAALYHSRLTTNALLLTVPLDFAFLTVLPFREKAFLLPVLAFSIPTIQYYLTPYTLQLGPGISSFVIELLTYGLMVALTLNITWQRYLHYGRFVPSFLPRALQTLLPPLIASTFLYIFERFMWHRIPPLFGSSLLFSRALSPLVLAFASAILLPSKYLLLAAVPFFHTILLNPHTPLAITTDRLNHTLATVNYTLLDRREGPTGYVSVLQNNEVGFRVMRCDHSLLGGEWVYGVGNWIGGKGFQDNRAIVGEPVYTVFLNLEATRLIQDAEVVEGETNITPLVADRDAKALVIGLGIGTTPAALAAHGIDTTVVEIDPVVFDFARDYFSLPVNLTGIVQDATVYVQHSQEMFDYIVHDVFTGGAEPAELFTVEFLEGLKSRLKDEGVIAINYAGDLLQPPAALIVRTILSVFPGCRLFREDESKDDPTMDFTNIVFFCRKNRRPFIFREPVNADFLGTMSRRQYLLPVWEVDPNKFDLEGEKDGIGKVLSEQNINALEKWRAPGAIGHWEVMRTVLPALVWENW